MQGLGFSKTKKQHAWSWRLCACGVLLFCFLVFLVLFGRVVEGVGVCFGLVRLCGVLGKECCELVLVGAEHLVDGAAVLVDLEGWHGTHRSLGSGVAVLVDVNLEALDLALLLLGKLLEMGGNDSARAAPRRGEVDNDNTLLDGLVEVVHGLEVLGHLGCGGEWGRGGGVCV